MSVENLVSVIIPTYNCGEYVCDAVKSVLEQTYKEKEVIVVDDGSTDNTAERLKREFGNKIIYKYKKINKGGPAAPRNVGMKIASGQYIAFLDADDLWKKDKLKRTIDFMKDNKFRWCFTGFEKVTMSGESLGVRTLNESVAGYDAESGDLYDISGGVFSFKKSLPLYPFTFVFERSCIEKIGFLDERLKTCDDTDFCLRLQDANIKGGFLNEVLSLYRLRNNSTSQQLNDELFDIRRIAWEHIKRNGGFGRRLRYQYALLLWEHAARYYNRKRFVKATRCLVCSMILDFRGKKVKKILRTLISRGSRSK